MEQLFKVNQPNISLSVPVNRSLLLYHTCFTLLPIITCGVHRAYDTVLAGSTGFVSSSIIAFTCLLHF